MKPGIHPDYMECQVTCACGATFTTRSTRPELHVEICSQCHPFFSGQQRIVDSEGRVEQFIRRYGLQSRYEQEEAEDATGGTDDSGQ